MMPGDMDPVMWGDGSKAPREGLFRWQFEPDGEGFLYRKNLRGHGIWVSRAERVAFVRAHETRILTTVALTILVYILAMGVFIVFFEGVLAADRPSDAPPLLAPLAAVAFGIWRIRWSRGRPAKMLAGRPLVGLCRSARDARTIRMALRGWRRIGYCAALAGIVVIVALKEGERPALSDWLWIAPLIIGVVAVLGCWSLIKLRAVRAYRAAGGLPIWEWSESLEDSSRSGSGAARCGGVGGEATGTPTL